MQNPDIALARHSMIKCQLEPNGVINAAILHAFDSSPRHDCVPDAMRLAAYADADINLGEGRSLVAPMTLAKLLQAAMPRLEDTALVIGGNTGYSALILSQLVGNLYMLEDNAEFLARAEALLQANDTAADVILAQGPLSDGLPRHAPYSLIVLDGAVPCVPQHVLAQLTESGRLVGVEGQSAVLYQKTGGDAYSRRVLFDITTKILPGGWKAERFAL
ncbi:MAG: protein-L-isoaspartate O-methyltransferase [Pseudomonadota bacterium]